MLDLQARVHLEEPELASFDEELDRARALVADGAGGGDRRIPHAPADRAGDDRRRGLLHHLLVPPLHRAFPVVQVDDAAVGVGEHLHLHVARRGQETLDEHLVRPERGRRLAPGGGDRLGQFVRVRDHAHAAATPARRGLDQEREADRLGRCRRGRS